MPPPQSRTPPALNGALLPLPLFPIWSPHLLAKIQSPGEEEHEPPPPSPLSSASEDGHVLLRTVTRCRHASPPTASSNFFLCSCALLLPRISHFFSTTISIGSKQAQLFSGNRFVGTPLHRLLRFYFYKMQIQRKEIIKEDSVARAYC
uniref:Uncharacterized protein n=1 Tax=Oryza glumipatula TaxID=40148 RepID=A0A0E0B9J4_9ORYZ